MTQKTTQEVADVLDHTFCKLESLGTAVTQLSTMENQKPDLDALADLGRLISEQAMLGLDLVPDLSNRPQPISRASSTAQTKTGITHPTLLTFLIFCLDIRVHFRWCTGRWCS